MRNLLPRLALAISMGLFGNYVGDQATIKDCAIKGTAVMAGGGAIKCEIIKDSND